MTADDLPEAFRQEKTRPRVLVVDDEPAISSFLRMGLDREGYDVQVASDGPEALHIAHEQEFDLVILDLNLPGMDGTEVCRGLRSQKNLAILMLTARQEIADRVSGLDAGADDYLLKPFDFTELLARIRALLRRNFPDQEKIARAGSFSLDEAAMEVRRDGVAVPLSPREYSLFRLFFRQPRHVLTRDVILTHVWGGDYLGEANVVDVYVRYLRNKLDPEHQFIRTVRGLGYRFVP